MVREVRVKFDFAIPAMKRSGPDLLNSFAAKLRWNPIRLITPLSASPENQGATIDRFAW